MLKEEKGDKLTQERKFLLFNSCIDLTTSILGTTKNPTIVTWNYSEFFHTDGDCIVCAGEPSTCKEEPPCVQSSINCPCISWL